jgi:4-diphosphocytidyl-2-C-methyl-D-erythritol kinase
MAEEREGGALGGGDAGLRVLAPAKVNLSLEVLARRDDGYHEIRTVMHAVSLFDEMTFRRLPARRVELRCDDPAVPSGEDNLIVRAARLLQEQCGAEHGASVELRKRIPVGGGLGGGSSDAAVALLALRRLWEVSMEPGELCELAARLGSDVPFFLYGGTALCEGRGEVVTPWPCAVPLHFLLVVPEAPVSTAAVYGKARPLTGVPPASDNVARTLRDGSIELLGRCLRNDLQAAALALHEDLQRIWDGLAVLGREIGAAGCLLSGSGSSFFVLLPGRREAERAARVVVSRLGLSCASVRSVPAWGVRIASLTAGRECL